MDLLNRGWRRVREEERERIDGVWGRDLGARYDVDRVKEREKSSSTVGGRGY